MGEMVMDKRQDRWATGVAALFIYLYELRSYTLVIGREPIQVE
jgi:hypothetical protein